MLCQRLWVIVWYVESVLVNYFVLCLCIMASYTEPVAVKLGLLCCAGSCVSWCAMLSQGCESWCAMLSRVVVSYGVSFRAIGCKSYKPVVVNHGVLYWGSGFELVCAMLNLWLWIMVCYSEPVIVSHDEICWAIGLLIMVCYAEPVAVNGVLLCWASGSASWFIMLSQWLWIIVS